MQFQDIISLVREQFKDADASVVPGKLAVQFDITGEGGGIFYAEVKDSVLAIEPFEYHDRDVRLIMDSGDFIKMMRKELNPIAAFTVGKLKVDGDIGKALEITKFLE